MALEVLHDRWRLQKTAMKGLREASEASRMNNVKRANPEAVA